MNATSTVGNGVFLFYLGNFLLVLIRLLVLVVGVYVFVLIVKSLRKYLSETEKSPDNESHSSLDNK